MLASLILGLGKIECAFCELVPHALIGTISVLIISTFTIKYWELLRVQLDLTPNYEIRIRIISNVSTGEALKCGLITAGFCISTGVFYDLVYSGSPHMTKKARLFDIYGS